MGVSPTPAAANWLAFLLVRNPPVSATTCERELLARMLLGGLVIVWILVLGYPLVVGRQRPRGDLAIGAFNRQLRCLERAAPTAVQPAHSLAAASRDRSTAYSGLPYHQPLGRRRAAQQRRLVVFIALLGVTVTAAAGALATSSGLLWLLAAAAGCSLALYVAALLDRRTRVVPAPAAPRLAQVYSLHGEPLGDTHVDALPGQRRNDTGYRVAL